MAWRFHSAVPMLMLAALYFGAGKFGLSLAFVNTSTSPVWPPTGLALAALLLWGNRLGPGVFIGAFLVNITTPGSTLATTLGIATGNTLEALVAAMLVRRFANGANVFERTPDIFRFVLLAAMLSTTVSATFGATSLALGGLADWYHYRTIWLTWWLGDVTSNLTVAPLLLVWWKSKLPKLEPQKMAEAAAILATAILVCVVVFTDIIPFAYLTLLPLAWAVYRFGVRTALAVMLLISGMALYSTLRNEGPFASPDPNHAVLYLQAFMGINTILVLVLTAAIAERTKAEQRLEVQYAVSRVLAEAAAVDESTPKILKTLCEAGGWDAGVLWKVDRATNELFCAEVWHDPAVAIPELTADSRRRRLTPGTCLPGQVWSGGGPLWIPDIARHDHFPRAPIALREGLHAAVGFPLKVDREMLGVIECFSREVRTPDDEFLHMLAALGSQAGQFIERQRAVTATLESETRFRQVTEAINEVFWMTDVEKNQMVYISPGYETVWGRTCASLYAAPRNWIEAIHPGDRERVLEAALSKQTLGQYDEVYRILRPGGALRWIHDRAFPLRDAAGKVYRIVGIAADITRQKQVEESLRQSEVRKSAIMETALDGILTIDQTGQVVEFNSAAERIFGCDRTWIVGRELAAVFVPPAVREWFQRGLAQQFLAREGPPLGSRTEMKLLRRDGGEFPAELSLTRFELAGKPMFTIFLRDVTELKQAETQIATLAHAARSTAEMICITDLNDRFTFANRAFQETYGYTEAEILGQKPELLFSPDNPPGLMAEILAQTRAGGWRGEVRDRRKDGSGFSVYLSTSAIKDADGRVIGLMGVGQDITERKQAEEKIRLLADAMESVQEMISITDSENRFTFVNEAFLKAYGYTAEEILGRTPDFLYAANNPPGLCSQVYQQTLRGGWRGELSNSRKDGTVFPISLTTSEIKSRDGKTLGLVGLARDISERRWLERQTAALAALGHRLSEAATPGQAATIILEVASDLFGWDASYVHLYSEADDQIIPVLTFDTVEGERQHVPVTSFTLDPSPLMRRVMQEGPQLINHSGDVPRPPDLVPIGNAQRPSASMMYVPIRTDKAVLGMLSIQSYTPHTYTAAHLALFQTLAEHCSGALERIRAEGALRDSEQRFRSLVESAPVAIALQDAHGKILETNQAYQRMVGYSAEELRRLGVKRITHPEDVREGARLYEELRQGKRNHYRREKRYQSKHGMEVWATSHVSAVRDGEGRLRYIISLVEDITLRRKAQKELRELAAIVESSSDAILSVTLEGDLVSWNQAAGRIYGYTAEEVIGHPVIMLFPTDRAGEEARVLQKVRQGKRIENFETVHRRKDGTLVEISLTISPIRDGVGKVTGASAIGRDIGPRKQLEREILESSDSERRRIGHDLHDGLGQILAGIALKTQVLYETLAAEGSTQVSEAEEIVRLVNDTIRQTRMLARGLDPVDAEANGLPSALQSLAVQTEYLFRVDCTCQSSPPRLVIQSPTGMALYRIAQEAIHNAVVHGHARRIEIRLAEAGTQITLSIRDNGKGFTPEATGGGGMGLRIMQYRANSVGGILAIHSAISSGTEVECIVPNRLSAPQKTKAIANQ